MEYGLIALTYHHLYFAFMRPIFHCWIFLLLLDSHPMHPDLKSYLNYLAPTHLRGSGVKQEEVVLTINLTASETSVALLWTVFCL